MASHWVKQTIDSIDIMTKLTSAKSQKRLNGRQSLVFAKEPDFEQIHAVMVRHPAGF